jgi:hypothetical protein
MAHGPRGPKYALDKVWDRNPKTPVPGLKLHDPPFAEPLIGIGGVEGTSLQDLQRDQDLLRLVAELLPLDEVRAAVQGYARQSEALTEALGGRELVAAILGELDGALSREDRALLHSELEHELGGPLDDAGEGAWSEREAKHARHELTRSWVARVLAAVHDQRGIVPLDGELCPDLPAGRSVSASSSSEREWEASAEDVEDALLASIAVKPEGLVALRKVFHAKVMEVVARNGSLELPGRVELTRRGGGLVAHPYR